MFYEFPSKVDYKLSVYVNDNERLYANKFMTCCL